MKPWYQSATVHGVLAMVISSLVRAIWKTEVQEAEVVNVLTLAGQFIGGLVALLGRTRAEQPVAWRPSAMNRWR